jgi:hypothetical protein
LFGQTVGSRLADATADKLGATDEKFPSEEGSSGQNNRLRLKNPPSLRMDADDF